MWLALVRFRDDAMLCLAWQFFVYVLPGLDILGRSDGLLWLLWLLWLLCYGSYFIRYASIVFAAGGVLSVFNDILYLVVTNAFDCISCVVDVSFCSCLVGSLTQEKVYRYQLEQQYFVSGADDIVYVGNISNVRTTTKQQYQRKQQKTTTTTTTHLLLM